MVERVLALFGRVFFGFVYFGDYFLSLGKAEGERLVLWSLGCFSFLMFRERLHCHMGPV